MKLASSLVSTKDAFQVIMALVYHFQVNMALVYHVPFHYRLYTANILEACFRSNADNYKITPLST